MGGLRLILALGIVAGHYIFLAKNYGLMGGDKSPLSIFPYLTGSGWDGAIKVNAFFIIAGFYAYGTLSGLSCMTLSNVLAYYRSRVLRLMPLYYVVLFLTVLGRYYAADLKIKVPTVFYTPDMLHSVEWWRNILVFVPEIFRWNNFNDKEVFMSLLVGHAWTLSILLFFTLIAPFFFSNAKRFWLFFAISGAMAAYAYSQGIIRDYLVASLVHFALGGLARIGYEHVKKPERMNFSHRILGYGLVMAIAIQMFFFGWSKLHLGRDAAYGFFIVSVIVSLPFIAAYTQKLSWDRFVGDMAFPIYLFHFLVFALAECFLRNYGLNIGLHGIVFITCLLSFFLTAMRWPFTPQKKSPA